MTKNDNIIISAGDFIRKHKLSIVKSDLPPDDFHMHSLVMMDPSTLNFDNSYQRAAIISHALNIAQNFEFKNMKPLIGFKFQDGPVYITDGQHTCIGATLAGKKQVPVWLTFIDKPMSEKAILQAKSQQFYNHNKNQKPIGKFYMYRNELNLERPWALDVQEICKRTNTMPMESTTTNKKIPGAITHIHHLSQVYHQIGPVYLEKSLNYIRKFWPNAAIHGSLFPTFARFFRHHDDAKKFNAGYASYDPNILYQCLTQNGASAELESVFDLIKDNMGAVKATSGIITETHHAKVLTWLYNQHIRKYHNGVGLIKEIY